MIVLERMLKLGQGEKIIQEVLSEIVTILEAHTEGERTLGAHPESKMTLGAHTESEMILEVLHKKEVEQVKEGVLQTPKINHSKKIAGQHRINILKIGV
jgi:hypothetical protein